MKLCWELFWKYTFINFPFTWESNIPREKRLVKIGVWQRRAMRNERNATCFKIMSGCHAIDVYYSKKRHRCSLSLNCVQTRSRENCLKSGEPRATIIARCLRGWGYDAIFMLCHVMRFNYCEKQRINWLHCCC